MTDTAAAAGRPTLLAKLAPLFGPQTENLAVEALGHILSGSEAARRALSAVVRAGGAEIGEVAQVRTQATGEDGARPDLVGLDKSGQERLLIEAKFWAGLTENQPIGYLKRLDAKAGSSALLFVAPEARLEALWIELRRLVEESKRGLRFDESYKQAAVRGADVSDDRRLMLVSWSNLLDGIAAQAGDAHTQMDIRQLRGLAERQDEEAFLPLRREEFAPEIPRRLRSLQRLVDDATDRAGASKFLDISGLRVTPQAYGYGRYVKLVGRTTWFGIHANLWARTGSTPLWLWFWDHDLAVLDSLRGAVPPAPGGQNRFVPIYLPVGREYDAVLNAVVERLRETAELIQGSRSSPSAQTPRTDAESAPG